MSPCLQNSYAAGDRLIPTFEILTDKFEEATFFLRYIAFFMGEVFNYLVTQWHKLQSLK